MTATLTRRDIARGSALEKKKRVTRPILALGLATLGVALIVFEHAARGVEVLVASRVLPILFADGAVAARTTGSPSVAYGVDGTWFALVVTPECSIAFYVGAVVLLGAGLALVRRFRVSRILMAIGISGLGLVLLNQVRIAALAFVLANYSHDTFDWAHTIGGSFLMMAGLTGCLALLFVLVIRRRQTAAD